MKRLELFQELCTGKERLSEEKQKEFKYWSFLLKNRNFVNIISRRIKPESKISCNSWGTYTNIDGPLPEHDFEEHKIGNHSKNPINPDDPQADT